MKIAVLIFLHFPELFPGAFIHLLRLQENIRITFLHIQGLLHAVHRRDFLPKLWIMHAVDRHVIFRHRLRIEQTLFQIGGIGTGRHKEHDADKQGQHRRPVLLLRPGKIPVRQPCGQPEQLLTEAACFAGSFLFPSGNPDIPGKPDGFHGRNLRCPSGRNPGGNQYGHKGRQRRSQKGRPGRINPHGNLSLINISKGSGGKGKGHANSRNAGQDAERNSDAA